MHFKLGSFLSGWVFVGTGYVEAGREGKSGEGGGENTLLLARWSQDGACF